MTLLNIQNIFLKFSTSTQPILSNINYQIKKNDFVIILGSNGSGKSSLLKLLDRRYRATAGDIILENKSIAQYSTNEFSKKVITLTQNSHESLFTSLTVFENFLLTKQRHENKLFTLQQKQEREFFADYLQEFNPNLPRKLNQVVDKLSGGEKQALTLALSVLYPPEILLLDEHTSALDPKSGRQLMELTQRVVSEHKMTCILTTHDLDIALQYGNRILALRHGEIYRGIDHEKQNLSRQELLEICY